MTGNNTESLSNTRLSLCIHTFAAIIDLLFRQVSGRRARPVDPQCTARLHRRSFGICTPTGLLRHHRAVLRMLRQQAMGRDIFNVVDAKILPV